MNATGVSYAASKLGSYYVVAEDNASGCRSVPSNKVEVKSSGSTNNIPRPQLNDSQVSFCEGGSVTLTLDNANDPYYLNNNVTFQWHGKSQGMLTGPLMSGSSIMVSVADIYWVVAVEGSCQSGKSDEKEVVKSGQTALPRPETEIEDNVTEICVDGMATIVVTNLDAYEANHPDVTFQWYNESGIINGATLP